MGNAQGPSADNIEARAADIVHHARSFTPRLHERMLEGGGALLHELVAGFLRFAVLRKKQDVEEGQHVLDEERLSQLLLFISSRAESALVFFEKCSAFLKAPDSSLYKQVYFHAFDVGNVGYITLENFVRALSAYAFDSKRAKCQLLFQRLVSPGASVLTLHDLERCLQRQKVVQERLCEIVTARAFASASELAKQFKHVPSTSELMSIKRICRDRVEQQLLLKEEHFMELARQSWSLLTSGGRETDVMTSAQFCRRVMSMKFFDHYVDPHASCEVLASACSGEPSKLRDCLKVCIEVSNELENASEGVH